MITKEALRFLIVEDNTLSSQLIANQLEDRGHHVVGQAFDRLVGVELTKQLSPDVVLMDLAMTDPDTKQEDPRAGIKAAIAIQDECPTPVVVLTAYQTSELIYEATEAGIGAYLLKPPNLEEIERAAMIAIARFDDMQEMHRLKSLLDASQAIAHVGSWELDLVNNHLTWSDEAYRIFGLTPQEFQASYEAFLDVVHPDDRAAVDDAYSKSLREGKDGYEIEHRIVRQDSERVRVVYEKCIHSRDAEGKIVRSVGMVQDITERKQAQEQLRRHAEELEEIVAEKMRELEEERAKAVQMDKLASLGEMAAGVAHELAQPLAAIRFEADYLQEVAEKIDTDHQGDLNVLLDPGRVMNIGEGIARDLARCRRLVDHLRDFSRITQEPLESICLNDPIEDSLLIVGARLRNRSVDVQLDLAAALPPVLANTHRLEQVFLNLISNADHALACQAAKRSSHKKILEITTSATDNQVVAKVRDNGCGIPEDVQERIFDPFFTTKPEGEGTGLGLSISHDIVTEFDGEITCESIEGQGTTFTLRFPAVEPTKATA